MSLPLTEAQVSQVYRIARPLADPDGFLIEVAAALEQCPAIDDGVVFRVCRDVRLRHWTPPPEVGPGNHLSRWAR